MFSRSIRSALVDLRQAVPSSLVRTSIVPSQRAWLSKSSIAFNQSASIEGQTQASPAASSPASEAVVGSESGLPNNIPNQMNIGLSTGEIPSPAWQTNKMTQLPSLRTFDESNIDAEVYKLPVPPNIKRPFQITAKTAEMLPHLTAQARQGGAYITAHIHARPYLLTEGDTLRLPFLMPNVEPGDIIRLNRASVFGSRDFMLKGTPYIDERMFECRLCVLGTESEPLRVKEKTKRRHRHVQHIKSKHKFTIFKVKEVKIKTLEEILAEGAEIVQS